MAISSFCIGCILKRQEERIRELPFSDEKKEQFMKELCGLIAAAPTEATSPVIVADIRVLIQKYFDIVDSYEEEKTHFNQLMLEAEDVLTEMIESADEPLKEALRLARIGNYIDFGAMNHVDETILQKYIEDSAEIPVDEKEYEALHTYG